MKKQSAAVLEFVTRRVLTSHRRGCAGRGAMLGLLFVLIGGSGSQANPGRTFAQASQELFSVTKKSAQEEVFIADAPERRRTPTPTPSPTPTPTPTPRPAPTPTATRPPRPSP